jgi:hypothetical protein
MLLQFLQFDKHQAPPAPPTSYREDPRKHALKSRFSRKVTTRIKGVEKGVKEASFRLCGARALARRL